MTDINEIHRTLGINLKGLYAANAELESIQPEYDAALEEWKRTNPVAQRYAAAEARKMAAQKSVIDARQGIHTLVGLDTESQELPSGLKQRRKVDMDVRDGALDEIINREVMYLLRLDEGLLRKMVHAFVDDDTLEFPKTMQWLGECVNVNHKWLLSFDDAQIVASIDSADQAADLPEEGTSQAAD